MHMHMHMQNAPSSELRAQMQYVMSPINVTKRLSHAQNQSDPQIHSVPQHAYMAHRQQKKKSTYNNNNKN